MLWKVNRNLRLIITMQGRGSQGHPKQTNCLEQGLLQLPQCLLEVLRSDLEGIEDFNKKIRNVLHYTVIVWSLFCILEAI